MENSIKLNLGESIAYNSGLIKQGYLDLCYLSNVSDESISESIPATIAGLRSQPVLVCVHRRPGEFYAILQFESGSTSCLNLRHCRAEPCENRRYLKLMLNDFTSGLLFRICRSPPNPVVLLTEHTEMQELVHKDRQLMIGEALDDLSVINKNEENKLNKDSQDEEKQLDWVKAFSEPAQWPAKLCPSFGFRRSQSLQTVYESDEELEEEKVRSTSLMI